MAQRLRTQFCSGSFASLHLLVATKQQIFRLHISVFHTNSLQVFQSQEQLPQQQRNISLSYWIPTCSRIQVVNVATFAILHDEHILVSKALVAFQQTQHVRVNPNAQECLLLLLKHDGIRLMKNLYGNRPSTLSICTRSWTFRRFNICYDIIWLQRDCQASSRILHVTQVHNSSLPRANVFPNAIHLSPSLLRQHRARANLILGTLIIAAILTYHESRSCELHTDIQWQANLYGLPAECAQTYASWRKFALLSRRASGTFLEESLCFTWLAILNNCTACKSAATFAHAGA
mmetsp:Transcript_16385/g.37774  ORF Transcript_16385/g.37774 Transcript_16385/m.37774 type:complete len:290 (-) Transcript_16385:142-1011(-)